MSLIITLTGMSTSGKSTLAKALSQTEHFSEAVSVTTRAKRPGEVDGVDYHFVTPEQFDRYVEDGVLLEHVRSHHAAYGVPSFEVDKILKSGKSPVLVLEPIGVQSINRVAQERNYNFMSVYVHADITLIMQRFFDRIQHQISTGKEVNYQQEAKRLHTMLTIEKTWENIWPWDLTVMNLHVDNDLDGSIKDFIRYHKNSSVFEPYDYRLNESLVAPSCKPQAELALLIEKAIRINMQPREFYEQASTASDKRPKPNELESCASMP